MYHLNDLRCIFSVPVYTLDSYYEMIALFVCVSIFSFLSIISACRQNLHWSISCINCDLSVKLLRPQSQRPSGNHWSQGKMCIPQPVGEWLLEGDVRQNEIDKVSKVPITGIYTYTVLHVKTHLDCSADCLQFVWKIWKVRQAVKRRTFKLKVMPFPNMLATVVRYHLS